jgi:DNA helicase HerA-like ATPase
LEVNGQVIQIKGSDIVIAYHPEGGEPRPGDALLLTERGGSASNDGLVVQVIGHDSAGYPGDREAALAELLEAAIADRHQIVHGEPAMVDLKEIKLARAKIRKIVRDRRWHDWDGSIPTRNVDVSDLPTDMLLDNVTPKRPTFPVGLARYRGSPIVFDAPDLDKVNALVGLKGSGKSHSAKLLLAELVRLGAPCWAFDINREFVDLPGADAIRVGVNYQLRLDEVGFPFLMAVVDDMNRLTDVSRGAFEHTGPRFIEQEVQRRGIATIGYLLDRAEQGAFHSNDMVNTAIETRLRMVRATGLFADDPAAESLSQRFDRIAAAGGFLAFDLAEIPLGRLRALVRGLNRRLDAVCEAERQSGRGRYPFVFYEEAHFYAAPEEILNLITRGRHLGITTFFVTNSPGELPEVVFRQLDNLVVTGLSHSADLRTIAKCSLSDEETLQSLAVGLRPTEALVIGRLTRGFPLVVDIDNLPAGWPPTGATRSFWTDRGAA